MKRLNKKGFTLIELLAVIVILAILVAVSVPAVTRYLNTARKGTFADNAQVAISAVRNDVISKFEAAESTTYDLSAINALLEKKLIKSPYGREYTAALVTVTLESDNSYSYSVCLTDGTVGINAAEADIDSDSVLSTVTSCTVAPVE